MGFVHLHVHTEYSLLHGACKIDQLVDAARTLGFRALAITDKDVVYGLIPFYKACKKAAIQPVLGLEVTLKDAEGTSLLLYAKGNAGYRNLLAISTIVQTSKSKVKGIERDELGQYASDLIAVIPFHGGDILQHVKRNDRRAAKESISFYQKLFGKDMYIEIQRRDDEDGKWLVLLSQLAKETGTSLIASNHVHFVKKEDIEAYQVVNAIRKGMLLSQTDNQLEAVSLFLKSEQEMRNLFSDYEEAVENSVKLAESCNVVLELGNIHMPKFAVPPNQTSDEYLKLLCENGLSKRYDNITEEIQSRLSYELDVICRMGFSDYFLIVWDFMKYAHQNGILTGPGRGSAAGSLVAYVLQITNVDPIKYQLLFERFLNPERVSMPDIDIDFPDERREEVLNYVMRRYGSKHVAHILTFGTLAAKAAIRDVGKVLGSDSALIEKVAKMIPNVGQITLEQAAKENSQLRELIRNSQPARRLYELARKVEGMPRHSSTHAAGIIISDQPLTERVALQEGQGTVYVSQYTMDILEEIGLLKMDFLGLRNLTLLEEITTAIKQTTGEAFSLKDISLEDKSTFDMLGRGETTGVFQLESAGMRQVLKKLKPTRFEDIVAVNALFRPGPMENIPQFIARKHKSEAIHYPHPDLEPILKSTYGVIVYQEQIMQIASVMAGFSLGQADLLRRAVSKKKRDVLEKERLPFVAGAVKKGYSEEVASQVYELIIRFADYGFNRSHAVAYSMIAYQLAYLKANYPQNFYASLLSSSGLHQEKLLFYLQELRQQWINVFPPDINKSNYRFCNEKQGIRFGLMAIRHIGYRTAVEIVQKRIQGPYKSLADFCGRVDHRLVTKKGIEMLIIAGAFDSIDGHRSQLLASLDDILTFAQIKLSNNGDSLFQYDDETPELIDVPPFSHEEQLDFEKKMLGFYLSGHPISLYEDKLKSYERVMIGTLLQSNNGKMRIAGLLASIRQIKTKKGQNMAAGLLHDETAEVNLVIFPQLWSKYSHIFKEGSLLLVEGELEQQKEKISFIVSHAKNVKDLPLKKKETLYLRIEKEHEHSGILIRVKETLQAYPGDTSVILYYNSSNKIVDISRSFQITPSQSCLTDLGNLLGTKNVALKSEK